MRWRMAWAAAVGAAGLVTTAQAQVGPVSPALTRAPAMRPADWARVQATAATLRDQALAGSGAFPLLTALTTEFGPRLAGSANQHLAARWAAARLRAAGFANVHIESFPVPGWTRGEERGEIVGPAPQPLALTALGGSGATPPEGLTGDIVLFPTYAEMLAAPEGSLKGRIVVVTQPMTRTQDGSGYGAAGPIRFKGAAEAARRGAAAYLIRSLATGHSRAPHTGVTDFPAGMTPIPAAALGVPDAEQLDRLSAGGRRVRVHLLLTPRVRPGATADTVVADIPGRERPDEVVLIGGHLDSWDLGTGAIDDGAGVAVTTAAADLIRRLPQPPRRTLRLALFGAEEIGFAGPAFAKARDAAEQAKIVIAAECDFGAEPPYAIALPAGAAKGEFGRALAGTVAVLPTFVSPDAAVEGGEDVSHFTGVPVAELRQDGARYFDIHHSADDTLDQVDPHRLDTAVAAWVSFAYLAADSAIDFRNKP